MLKLTLLVILEIAVGLTAAGGLLGVLVPVMVAHHIIVVGDVAGSVIIGAVILFAVSAILLRPGSALRRERS